MKIFLYSNLIIAAAISAITPDNHDNTIIPNASYFVYDGEESSILNGMLPLNSKGVTFYTACGDPIQKIEHHFRTSCMKEKLDPAAPKPQPTTYKIVYWSGCPVINLWPFFTATKGVPGYFIVFFDKNGNKIKSYRYNINKRKIRIMQEAGNEFIIIKYPFSSIENLRKLNDFPLDLSIVKHVE